MHSPCADPPRIAARLRHAVRLGLLPKLARAEGRDPRLLAIVLRGALDGLAAVAPVGDPDWIGLRGDQALALDGDDPGAAARFVLRASSGDAESASALPGGRTRPSCMRRRRLTASARISTARTCWKAAPASPAPAMPAGSIARSATLAAGRRAPCGAPRCLRGRADRAAGGARPGAGAVVDPAATAAGERRHADAR